jgi:hypothetical protein
MEGVKYGRVVRRTWSEELDRGERVRRRAGRSRAYYTFKVSTTLILYQKLIIRADLHDGTGTCASTGILTVMGHYNRRRAQFQCFQSHRLS